VILPYLKIARFDHWFKNVFVLPGVIVAIFIDGSLLTPSLFVDVIVALLATGFIASSNYIVNEILDAPKDALHPVKKTFSLWVMGCIYNIPPVRSKDKPYIDVLSEAVNNPIRLLLGWYATGITLLPPVSLVIAYWMIGAYFMAAKRFGEYRMIGDKQVAGDYRNSFKFYNEERLIGSLIYYLAGFGLFFGIFLIRYKMELILSIPFIAGFTAWYFHLACKDDSPVQYPEKLYKETYFVVFTLGVFLLMIYLVLTDLPWLYSLFPATPA